MNAKQRTQNVYSLLLAGWLIASMVISSGCANPELTAYRTLSATSITVESSRQGFIAQANAGKVDKETYQKAKVAYEQYQASMALAFDALHAYQTSKGNPDTLDAAMNALLSAEANLLVLIKTFTQ